MDNSDEPKTKTEEVKVAEAVVEQPTQEAPKVAEVAPLATAPAPAPVSAPAPTSNAVAQNRPGRDNNRGGGGGGYQNRPYHQGGGNRGGFQGGRGQDRSRNRDGQGESEFFEKVVQVNRVSKKTKGGDKRSISVIVVVGDRKGKVGVGLGKAADVQSSVAKATAYAKKHMITVPLWENRTIPHLVNVKLGAAKVLIKPAPKGTGVIAGGAVRVVVEAAGIHDIVSKTLGTTNQASNVYATLEALKMLKTPKEILK